MTVEEAQAEITKLAQEAGLGKDETAQLLKAVENDKFRTGLDAGYRRQSDYSRGKDELAAEQRRLAEWHQKEMPKFQRYQQVVDEHRQYRDAYGELRKRGTGDDDDDDQGLNNGDRGGGRGGKGVSQQELDRYLDEKFKQRDAAYVGLTKSAVRISADYMKRFNDTLDVDAVEKIALEKGLPIDQAYEVYIAPKERAALEARHKEDIEKAKQEAVRDYQSRMKLPVDTRPRESHPFFDRKEAPKEQTPLDADRNSKEEFMQGWNNYEADLTKTAS